MSGFDFEALRDPDAPRPGTPERAGVARRARQLRARRLRNRMALSTTSIVAVVAIVLGVVAMRRGTGPAVQVEGPTATLPSSIADRFVPATSVDHGIVTVPVTLTDGETTTLRYPQQLRIAQLGFGGAINVRWPESRGLAACCGRDVAISYTSIARAFGTTTPVRVYPGPNGTSVPLRPEWEFRSAI